MPVYHAAPVACDSARLHCRAIRARTLAGSAGCSDSCGYELQAGFEAPVFAGCQEASPWWIASRVSALGSLLACVAKG